MIWQLLVCSGSITANVLIDNCLLAVGDKLDWINFFEVEDIQNEI